MAPSDLVLVDGHIYWGMERPSGLTWLARLAGNSPICLAQPIRRGLGAGLRTETSVVGNIFPMYELTLEGLDKAIKKLMVRK